MSDHHLALSPGSLEERIQLTVHAQFCQNSGTLQSIPSCPTAFMMSGPFCVKALKYTHGEVKLAKYLTRASSYPYVKQKMSCCKLLFVFGPLNAREICTCLDDQKAAFQHLKLHCFLFLPLTGGS